MEKILREFTNEYIKYLLQKALFTRLFFYNRMLMKNRHLNVCLKFLCEAGN